MDRMTELRNRIEEIQAEIDVKETQLLGAQEALDDFELDPYDYEDEYCEALDSDGPVIVCGSEFNASDIIKEMDPTMYTCGLIDYADSIDDESDPQYISIAEKIEELENDIEELNEEIDDLNEELNDMEEEDD